MIAQYLAGLDWAQPGELLLLPVHSERDQLLALLERKRAEGWRPRAKGTGARGQGSGASNAD